jgi:hypothetical protein
MRKRRIKINVGDIVSIPISDDKYCYGQFFDGDIMSGCYLIFDGLYEKPPLLEEIVRNRILLLAFTNGLAIAENVWRIIGNTHIPDNIQIPKFKVGFMENGITRTMVTDFKGNFLSVATENEINKLKNMTSCTPGLVEDAIKAQYGILPWNDGYNWLLYENITK